MNREQLSVAPDFLLGRGEENAIDISLLKTIRGWDIRNPKALSEIVSEMLATYREAQKRAVLAYPLERIHFEVSLIQDRVGAEFLLTQSPEHGAEVRAHATAHPHVSQRTHAITRYCARSHTHSHSPAAHDTHRASALSPRTHAAL